MKKSKKEINKIAKKLFSASFLDEELDSERIENIVAFAKSTYKSATLDILKAYLALVREFQKTRSLLVESPSMLDQRYLTDVKKYFESKFKRRLDVYFVENPNLLGGVQVSLGDDQWDLSAKDKINKIKEALVERYN